MKVLSAELLFAYSFHKTVRACVAISLWFLVKILRGFLLVATSEIADYPYFFNIFVANSIF